MRIESELGLFIRINVKLQRLMKDFERAKDVVRRADNSEDPDAYFFNDSLGRSLHNIYCGIETVLEDVAGEIDKSKPSGSSYHADLLDQMSNPTAKRPAVIHDSEEIRDLMSFRHLFRKLYGGQLRGDELREKLQFVENNILPDLMNSLESLKNHLEGDLDDPFENIRTSNTEDNDGDEPK